MAKITITQAAKMAGISRQHLYKSFINTGKISIIKDNDKPLIDISELLRVFPNVKLLTDNNDNILQQLNKEVDNLTHDDVKIITTLKSQLTEAKEREIQALEREKWLKAQIDELRQQQSNLLEHKTDKMRKKFLGIF